jgi:hypothetical protein
MPHDAFSTRQREQLAGCALLRAFEGQTQSTGIRPLSSRKAALCKLSREEADYQYAVFTSWSNSNKMLERTGFPTVAPVATSAAAMHAPKGIHQRKNTGLHAQRRSERALNQPTRTWSMSIACDFQFQRRPSTCSHLSWRIFQTAVQGLDAASRSNPTLSQKKQNLSGWFNPTDVCCCGCSMQGSSVCTGSSPLVGSLRCTLQEEINRATKGLQGSTVHVDGAGACEAWTSLLWGDKFVTLIHPEDAIAAAELSQGQLRLWASPRGDTQVINPPLASMKISSGAMAPQGGDIFTTFDAHGIRYVRIHMQSGSCLCIAAGTPHEFIDGQHAVFPMTSPAEAGLQVNSIERPAKSTNKRRRVGKPRSVTTKSRGLKIAPKRRTKFGPLARARVADDR